jgi:hypothetical protein
MHQEIKLKIEIPATVELAWNARSDFDKLATAFASRKTPNDQLEHLMTCFGYAAYEAQSLEGSLVSLLLLLARVRGETSTQEASRHAIEKAQKMTFGTLLGEIKGKAGNKGKLDLQPTDAQILEQALDLRNGLTHGFFLRKAEEILSEEGRKKIVWELVSGATAFRSAHLIVKALNGALAELAGMAPKLDAKMAKWLQREGVM